MWTRRCSCLESRQRRRILQGARRGVTSLWEAVSLGEVRTLPLRLFCSIDTLVFLSFSFSPSLFFVVGSPRKLLWSFLRAAPQRTMKELHSAVETVGGGEGGWGVREWWAARMEAGCYAVPRRRLFWAPRRGAPFLCPHIKKNRGWSACSIKYDTMKKKKEWRKFVESDYLEGPSELSKYFFAVREAET